MRFLALDASSKAVGWALFDGDDLLDYGCIDVPKTVDYGGRYQYITRELSGLIGSDHYFGEVVYEQAVKFKGRKIPELEVAVLSVKKWAERVVGKGRVYSVNTATWKAWLTGKATTDKEATADTVYMAFPDLPTGLVDHTTDAIGIGLYYWSQRKLELMATPKGESC